MEILINIGFVGCMVSVLILGLIKRKRTSTEESTDTKRIKIMEEGRTFPGIRTQISTKEVTLHGVAARAHYRINKIRNNEEALARLGEQNNHFWSITGPTDNVELTTRLILQNSTLMDDVRRTQALIHIKKEFLKQNNDENQHPEIFKRTGNFYEDDEELERRAQMDHARWGGYTFACNLEFNFGGEGFEDKATLGECLVCKEPLPIWRNCGACLHAFIHNFGKGALFQAQHCNNPNHIRDLDIVGHCEWHGGPTPIRVRMENAN